MPKPCVSEMNEYETVPTGRKNRFEYVLSKKQIFFHQEHTERNAKNHVDEVPVDEVPDVVSTINYELTCLQDDAAV